MKCFTRVDFTTNHHPFPDVQKGLSLDLATPACISSAWIWQQCTNPGAPQTGALCSMRGQSWKPRLWLGTACGSSPSASTAPAPGSTSRAHPPHGTHHWKQRKDYASPAANLKRKVRLAGASQETLFSCCLFWFSIHLVVFFWWHLSM